jgi:hypothetical protein
MDVSDHGLSHILKGPGAVVNSLADVTNVLVKCLCISIGAECARVFKCPDR